MEKSYTYHKVSEEEKEEIRKNSKELLNKFSSKLSSIKGVEEHFKSSVNPNGQRDIGEPWNTDPEFRDHFFSNAPFVEDEFLVAEKGDWKK